MIRNALNNIDYSLCAEIALILFALIFVAVCIRVLCTKRETSSEYARMILDDEQQTP